ncbi:MAG: hypothetical protein EXS46_01090 [Candidatus Taylorbacteria bacterium]|nr:hypothetical protein [Candidatus Taylorbacteria bacterium]
MSKKQRKTKEKWTITDNNASALVRAFLSMKSSAEMKAFMRDLLTESEIIEFSKRFYTAQAIAENTHYVGIERVTGLSSRTIARIKKWYWNGTGGYKLAIKRRK